MADLELEPPWPHVFELMWEAYVVGTIPVGAVVAASDGSIVAHGRNRIFDRPHSGQLAGTRLAHAEINALLGLSAERTYPELTLYSALEPCHLCLAAASASRVGSVHYAARDPYAGAVGKLASSQDMRLHPVTVEGPLSGPVGLFPELLHLRHMLWRVRDGRGIVPFYRQTRPELVELAQKLPAPPEATTLADAYVLVA
jgi:tRNA(Arg) A34 adenosine deaminase TadA